MSSKHIYYAKQADIKAVFIMFDNESHGQQFLVISIPYLKSLNCYLLENKLQNRETSIISSKSLLPFHLLSNQSISDYNFNADVTLSMMNISE
jgi:hypothetical protein